METAAPRRRESSLRELSEFAVELAWLAGRSTLAHFQTGVAAEAKPDLTPVTAADRAAERLLRERIEARFPEDGILGEELGEARPGARRRWILDPIDGTRSFVRGVPLFGVMIGLEEADDVVVGVLHFPALQETVSAARGLGCFLNGRRTRVSEVDRLEEALILTTDAERLPRQGRSEGWDALRFDAAFVRTWGDCYGHALVATGRAEAMIDPVSAPWDAAALRPIVEEAGGVFTDLMGHATHLGGSAISTNRALADVVRNRLAVGGAPGA
ncbi:MAG: histidinol-phosphatase [Longimicrobiales bacterium]